MNICEDSPSEGITLDLENIHANVPEHETNFVNSSQETPNNLVLYLVVNQNEGTNLSESSHVQELNETESVLVQNQNEHAFDIERINHESENVRLVDGAPSCGLEDELTSDSSSQHMISGFGTENVLGSVSEEIPGSGDGVLTDPLNVEDPITAQLLQPSLSEVNSNIDVAEIKQDPEEDEGTEIELSSDPVIQEKPQETLALPQGLVHQVSIGGQQFLLITGPPVQDSASVAQLTSDAGTSGLGTLVTTNTSGLATSAVNGDEPPAKRILLNTTPVLSDSLLVQQNLETSLSSTHFSREELQELNVIEFTDQVESVACVTSDSTVEQNVETLQKEEKTTEEMDVTQTWFTTKDDKVALQNTGKTWKQGQWSKDEVEVLQQNIAIYCKEHNINDPTEVIFVMTKEERKNFYRTISRGLNRPLFSVYRRVIRMYDSTNHIGKYSPEELEKLKDLRQKYGSDWAAIGTEMGRSPSSVKDRCRLMKDQCNSGKWLPEEERRLTEAVQRLTGMVPGESVTSGLSWAIVAEQVGTRSEKQCRTKWLNYLNWKQRGGTEWNRADDLALIDKVYNLCVTEENQIDWATLAGNWPSARSPQWLRGKWWSLKRHVQDYQLLSFPELIDRLKTNHRAIVRSLAANDSYAVKLPINLNLNVPGVSGNHIVEQYRDSSSENSHLTSDTNADPHLLPTLTQEQMVEMQPGRVSGTLKLIYHQQPAANSEATINLNNDQSQSSSDSPTHHFLNKIEKKSRRPGTEFGSGSSNFDNVGGDSTTHVFIDPVIGALKSRELHSAADENGLDLQDVESDGAQHLTIKVEPSNLLLDSNACHE